MDSGEELPLQRRLHTTGRKLQTKLDKLKVFRGRAYLELIQEVGDKEEELHSREAFPETLAFSDRERNQLVDLLQVAALVKKATGIEASWFGEGLRYAV